MVVSSQKPIELTRVNLNEVTLTQVSWQAFTKEYVLLAEQHRKALAHAVSINSTDLNKIVFANQMKL